MTVVTASIPGREELLAKCVRSVYAQTKPVECHLVMAQPPQPGIVSVAHCARQQNLLLQAVETEWTMRLADDDRLLPGHVEALLPWLSSEPFGDEPWADVIYSYDANMNRPRADCSDLSQEELVEQLGQRNWIDGSAVAIRTSSLREVGGWPTEYEGRHPGGHFKGLPMGYEDWACFYLLAQSGARFRCVPQFTWLYGTGAWAHISGGD